MTVDTWTIIGTGITIALLFTGLIAWPRSDMKEGLRALDADIKRELRHLSERLLAVERDVGRVQREVALVRAQLSLVLPALAQRHTPPAIDTGAD